MCEGLGNGETVVERTEDGGFGDADVGEGDGGVVGGHVECPFKGLDFYAWCVAGNDECGDAFWRAVLSGSASKDDTVSCVMEAGLPFLVAVDFIAGFAIV